MTYVDKHLEQNPRVGSFVSLGSLDCLSQDLWYSDGTPRSRYLSLVAPARDQTPLDADYKYGVGSNRALSFEGIRVKRKIKGSGRE